MWLLVIAFATPRVAHACSCVSDHTETNALARALGADLVFVGEAVSARTGPFLSGPVFEFSVSEVFAGDKDTDTIWVGTPGGSCNTGFTIGETYLVYASRSGDRFWTGPCHWNRSVLHAEADLLLLRESPLPEIPITLTVSHRSGALWIRYSGGPHRRWKLQSSSNLKDWTDRGEPFYGFYGPGETRFLFQTDLLAGKEFFRLIEVPD